MLASHRQDEATDSVSGGACGMTRPPVTASPSCWCCTASLGSGSSSAAGQTKIEITRLAGYQKQQPPDSAANSTHSKGAVVLEADDPDSVGAAQASLDLTQASDWMQFIEQQQQQQQHNIQEGGAGAYDTLRCDLLLQDHGGRRTTTKWNVWGQNFHLDRLEKSYQSLQHVTNGTKTAADDKVASKLQSSIARARKVSERMLQALLEEASRAEVLKLDSHKDEILDSACDDGGPIIQLVRLTWLWSAPPFEKDDDESIVVRGHAVCSTRPVKVFQPVKPIVCTIAADHHKHSSSKNNSDCSDSDSDITVDESLPSRWDHPQSKVASWTRLRKSLETPEAYKPSGVSEVLLVRPRDDRGGALELLEGLSSNLFVLYKDGTLRTPTEGVLHGYVRHLVLDCASACGVKVSDEPVLLDHFYESSIKEAFITSSSRLIFPISKMLLHDGQNEEGVPIFREFWQDPLLPLSSGSTDAMTNDVGKPKWQQLLDVILKSRGY